MERWRHLEEQLRHYCWLYGFEEIRTPIFEHTELFARNVGENSDIVSKEMYTFTDRSGRKITLRPEGTAAVTRSYLEHNLKDGPQPVKLFYMGPMFRYDRPQTGRYRQFHQFGLELFGSPRPVADVEIIDLSYKFLQSLHIGDLTLELNSVGCPECRPRFREELLAFLRPLESGLCQDCCRRFAENPLRALDCKDEHCRALMAEAPAITDHLCADCAAHFEQVKELLQELSIPYRLNPRLVRGLDYYTRTAFEFISGRAGAQSSLGGGGRYDYLVEQCGGPPTPGVGVAFGVERMLLAAGQETELRPETATVFVAAAGTGLTVETYRLAAELRQRGIAAEVELLERSLKAQLKYAGRKNIEKVVIIGERELEQGLVTLRDMAAGSQESIPRESLWEMLGAEQYTAGEPDQGPVQVDEEPLYRTAGCGTLRRSHAGRSTVLSGWVQRRRDHGGLIFIDLRDRSGLVQLVFDGSEDSALFARAETLRSEYVIKVEGNVVERTPGNVNPALKTGEIEVRVRSGMLSSSDTSFYIEDNLNVDENLRLQYRYLDYMAGDVRLAAPPGIAGA